MASSARPRKSWMLCVYGAIFLMLANFVGVVNSAASDDRTRLGNETIERTIQLRTHSIFAPYIDQDLQNRWWDFGGDSYVNTNKHVRLTRAKPSQMGWLWSRLPLSATNFVVEVEFKITGESSHLFGDGLAIWLTKERATPGPVFGSKNEFTGLGIFLDTYANSRHTYAFPRVNAMLGDGKTSYNVGNDGDGQLLAGCSANYRRTNVATKIKITYLKDKFLDIKVHYKAWDDWIDCVFIRNVTLPSIPYLGFSALTGDVFDAHDIISVSSSSAILSIPRPGDKPKTSKTAILKAAVSPTSETWTGFFLKLFCLSGLVAGGFYGFKEYKRRKELGLGFGMNSRGGGNFGNMRAPPRGPMGVGLGGGLGGGLGYDNKRF